MARPEMQKLLKEVSGIFVEKGTLEEDSMEETTVEEDRKRRSGAQRKKSNEAKAQEKEADFRAQQEKEYLEAEGDGTDDEFAQLQRKLHLKPTESALSLLSCMASSTTEGTRRPPDRPDLSPY